ncbi:5-Methylthioribose kinase, methionine salvage pathway [Fodinibius salinus]|uniref:5-Methylthioribose kinase, methionine salvage pathway n=1 Tax=Fodinibius salinus TaxID=860790 RepID=A0A5D3YJG3_9BACT|nr:phosphotransferase [Fodinibius salinus]TYP93645.1 5-Methylthioribose kinase, methionine salvage pathway [Fodinibius salinus]
MLSKQQILKIVSEKLPDFEPESSLQSLEGGNLNHVWRLKGSSRNLILKMAPPYIAANPEVPLDPKRIQFESKALQLFGNRELLNPLASREIRPPKHVFYDNKQHLLATEDLGHLPDISRLSNTEISPQQAGRRLGSFIGNIHRLSYNDLDLKKQFTNTSIQKTRREVQYNAAAEYAQRGGGTELKAIQSETQKLGKDLLESGCCLIMGDLWPSSILIDNDKLRIIDWEFSHFGRPLQDVGHFAAHCWMLAHTSSEANRKKMFRELWQYFWESYQEGTESNFSHLYDNQEYRDTTTHIGAEILIRAAGSFKNGYVYDGYDKGHPMVKEAVEQAASLIRADNLSDLWQADFK